MIIRYLLKSLALPPALNILIILFAILFFGSKPKLRNTLIFLSIASLAVLAMPVTTHFLAQQLEVFPAIDLENIDTREYQAIVVLGAGRHRDAPEYGGDVPKALGLERLRYAAKLQRETGLPIMVAGGLWGIDAIPESEFMAQIIEREFMGSVSWRESSSRTTWENAIYSKQLADRNEIQKILLVTHAWHMPRAVFSFKKAGFELNAAPTGFRSIAKDESAVMDFMPQANALFSSTLMLHEMLGLLWYRFDYE